MKKVLHSLLAVVVMLSLLVAGMTFTASAEDTVTTHPDVYNGEYATDTHSGIAHIIFGTVTDVSAEYGVIVEDEAGSRKLYQGKSIGVDGKFGIALYNVPDGDYVAYAYTGSGNSRVLGDGVEFTVGSLYKRTGNAVIMGERAGTVVTDTALISTLDTLTPDLNGKIFYDGGAYLAYVAEPYTDNYTFSSGDKIINGKKYYFALSDLSWTVVSETDTTMTLIADEILVASPFDTTFGRVEYANSDVKGVVEGLKSICLTEAQQNISTAFTLPTISDISAISNKSALLTDYAKATGAYSEDLADYSGKGAYWLQDEATSGYANLVEFNGLVIDGGYPVHVTYVGVRPMVTVTK